jgi:hypothetical protein
VRSVRNTIFISWGQRARDSEVDRRRVLPARVRDPRARARAARPARRMAKRRLERRRGGGLARVGGEEAVEQRSG